MSEKPSFFSELKRRNVDVEAYHLGMARSVLYRMGTEAREAANALSDARDKLCFGPPIKKKKCFRFTPVKSRNRRNRLSSNCS
jgi:hypothetical protein